ncbi:MAG: RNA polymerase sigma factor [Paludibacteraceae bacterium]|nr:RNA polymerase sigma factor [Paludibacteraceae bacterium]
MDNKEERFNHLVNDHKRTIYTVCYMFSNQTYEVEELYQEILIRLWMGFGSFKGQSEERTWVYRVALNTAINRRKSRLRRIETVPLTLDIDPIPPDDFQARQVQELHDNIGRLGPMDRALVLLWLEDLSYADIGAIMGISASNVGSRLLRIKNKLIEMSNKSN